MAERLDLVLSVVLISNNLSTYQQQSYSKSFPSWLNVGEEVWIVRQLGGWSLWIITYLNGAAPFFAFNWLICIFLTL